MQFYVLKNMIDVPYLTLFSKADPVNRGDPVTCPECGEHRGSLTWLPPYRAEIQAHGRALGDVAHFSGSDYLVSERFREVWIKEGLCGIDSFDPLERLRIRPARLGRQGATYFHIAPRRFETRIDRARSHIQYSDPNACSLCGGGNIDKEEGLAIDESTWSGEDIFVAWGNYNTFVSDRVRKLRDDYKLTNVNLVPTELYCTTELAEWYIKGEEPYADRHEERFTG